MNNNFELRKEQTRTSSLTFHNSDQQMQGIRETESTMAPEWTDEKHSMYIKSIEASFVNQLYDAKQMNASLSCKGTSSGQFKVLRGGCWQKINFQRENPQLSRTNQCQDLTENPWIQHYRSSSKHRSIAAPSLQESVTTTSKVVDLGEKNGTPSGAGHIHLCESHVHKDMLSSETEMSGQNFVDEEVKGKKQKKKGKVKRQRSLVTDSEGNDQMVPHRKSSSGGDFAKNFVSAA